MAALWDDKAQEIEQILNEEEVDLWRLRELALSEGGLVNGTLYHAECHCCVGYLSSSHLLFIFIFL
jgi:hypothetical protein